jgi:hypothetical protein
MNSANLLFPSVSRLALSSEVARDNVQGIPLRKAKIRSPDIGHNTINDIYFAKLGADDGDISRRIGKVEGIDYGPTKT